MSIVRLSADHSVHMLYAEWQSTSGIIAQSAERSGKSICERINLCANQSVCMANQCVSKSIFRPVCTGWQIGQCANQPVCKSIYVYRMAKQRQGRVSDALLSCPSCFTTLCIDCQQHERIPNQYRAMFVQNCKVCWICWCKKVGDA